MKKIITFIAVLAFSMSMTYASDWKIQLVENDYGYLEVQMKCINASLTPSAGDAISGMTFQIYWPTSLGADIDLICTSNAYNVTDANSSSADPQTSGINSFREYYLTPTPFNTPTTWTTGFWETITSFKITEGSGTGDFAIANDLELGAGLNWQFGDPIVTYHPDVDGSISGYTYPTVVYDLVWTGAGASGMFQDAHSWSLSDNWADECGGGGAIPTSSHNCFIPSGLSNYPENFYSAMAGGTGASNNVRVQSGGQINFGSTSFINGLAISGNLFVYGTLTITPDGQITVTGDTYVDAAEGLIVQATVDGVGSFLNTGTITYGGSGTAKVQTYLTSSVAVSGNLYIHQVGPTVDEENYTGGGTGAYLSAFAINASTYAYEYNDGWQNISSNTFEVRTANGIGLSTSDNTAHTLEMTGALMTGPQSSPTLVYGVGANNYELISNPYPSSVDFDALAAANGGVNNAYWIWNPVAGNYVERAGNAGAGSQYIQVGQGFFVETNAGGTFDFTNDERSHSDATFREIMVNILNITVEGGLEGYRDDVVVRFDDEATSGYDKDLEAAFWESQNSDATSLRTVAEGDLELAINVLPTTNLTSGMSSVPMNFSCGYNTEYTISFFDMETFEIGTEIWLEDKQTGAEWISVNDNPDYTFTATADDLEDRFVLHFFGPTGVDEFEIGNTVDIFSYRQSAFVRNNTNEVIKEVNIYTLAGELLQSNKPSDLKLTKFWVSDNMGYYVVRVITDKNVYTEKVFISK